jgi:FAD binding domain
MLAVSRPSQTPTLLKRFTDFDRTSYEETWVALNWHISLPTRKTHPDFPLWNLGYTAEDVFDLFFPNEFRFLCNPRRPAVCGRFGPPADRLWRFEFVVRKGEDPMAMAEPESTSKIIHPYITHPGSRYGLSSPVQYPTDCIRTLRSRPFCFSARSCNKWALGRVILAGDAAHVFPPFGGQGIASGFRDASSLAWRLAILSRNPHSVDHDRVLAAWYAERKQQLERSLAATIQNGAYVTESDPWKAFVRDWYLWAIQLVPGWKRDLEKGPRKDGMIRYQYQSGMPFLPQYGGGVCFPQVYCTGLDGAQNAGPVAFTDDLIFAPLKEGLCQVVVLVDRVDEVGPAVSALTGLSQLSQGLVREDEATIFVHDFTAKLPADAKVGVGKTARLVRIATGPEFAADVRLCTNRPAPRYYDAYRMKHEVHGKKFVIVRPDRFVYAACSNMEELQRAAKSMPQALTISTS